MRNSSLSSCFEFRFEFRALYVTSVIIEEEEKSKSKSESKDENLGLERNGLLFPLGYRVLVLCDAYKRPL